MLLAISHYVFDPLNFRTEKTPQATVVSDKVNTYL